MGKNKLGSKTAAKSKNPIYKKAVVGAPLKTKSKTKQVKTNLKKLKINNKEAISSLDQKLGTFREALQKKKKKVKTKHTVKSSEEKSSVNVEETTENLSRL